jgi:hypothetical protein
MKLYLHFPARQHVLRPNKYMDKLTSILNMNFSNTGSTNNYKKN